MRSQKPRARPAFPARPPAARKPSQTANPPDRVGSAPRGDAPKSDLGSRREWIISADLDGAPLGRAVRSLLDGAPWTRVKKLIETGKIRVDGQRVTDAGFRLRANQRIHLDLAAPRSAEDPLPPDSVVYLDAQLVVVHKPAGISTVPFDENEHGTLDQRIAALLEKKEGRRRPPLGIVHRLDKETSGLLVFARTLPAQRSLKNQFRFHTVRRRYWAVVDGAMTARTLSSRLVQDRGDGLRGSTDNPILGRSATTHVRVLERLPSATLVECQLETGRTHQIRIHLSEAGHPVLGDRVYTRGYPGPLTPAPRLMLHAFELGFEHPTTAQPLHFTSPLPDDIGKLLQSLRAP